jgi:hypothetical protein
MATHHRFRSRWVAAGFSAVLLASCGVSGGGDGEDADGAADPATTEAPAPDPSVAPSPPVEDYGTDQCPTAEAVGEVLGSEVEQGPWGGTSFSGDLTTSSSGCSYSPVDAESMFDDQVTISRLSVDVALADRLFEVMDRAAVADVDENGFTPLADLGDGAVLDGREVAMRVGDAIVWIEVEPEGGAEPGADNPAIDLAAAAVDLELSGEDPPRCDALEGFVADELGPVADGIPHSKYLGFGDTEITGEGCAVELEDGTEVTIAVSTAEAWDAWLDDNEDSDFNVTYRSLDVLGRPSFDDGNRLVVDDGTTGPGDSPFEIESSSTTLDEAQQAKLRIALAELAIGS